MLQLSEQLQRLIRATAVADDLTPQQLRHISSDFARADCILALDGNGNIEIVSGTVPQPDKPFTYVAMRHNGDKAVIMALVGLLRSSCKRPIVGDTGMRYEVRCDDGDGNEMVVGHTTDPTGGKLVEAVNLHPSWNSPKIVDREKPCEK